MDVFKTFFEIGSAVSFSFLVFTVIPTIFLIKFFLRR